MGKYHCIAAAIIFHNLLSYQLPSRILNVENGRTAAHNNLNKLDQVG